MRSLTLLLVALLAAPAGQQPPSQTFRTGVQAVEVDVRVIGKDGRFVSDLGLADFELREDGVQQKIQSVTLVAGPSGSVPSAASATAPTAASAPSSPRVPSVWVFVFDTVHLSPGSLQRTRDAVVSFIDQKLHDGDLGGVVADGKMANNRLTTNREELRTAAAAVKMPGNSRSRLELTREWPRFQDEYEAIRVALDNDPQTLEVVILRACQDDPDACKSRIPVDVIIKEKANRLVTEIQHDTQTTLSSVEALSNGLTKLTGPKTVVFVTDGFVIEKLESEMQNVVGRANRAGVHVYTIDARGLNKGSAGSDIIDKPAADSPIGAMPRVDLGEDGPNSLAVDTGAIAIRNQNNVGRALDDIQRDAGTYYVVAYAPTNERFDGKFRSISVKVDRPNVRVRARRGYLALEPAKLLRPEVITTAPPPVPVPAVDAAFIEDGLYELPEASRVAIAEPSVIANAGTHATSSAGGIRARVDAGKMALALGGDPRAATDAASAGWSAYERGDVETAARELSKAAATPDAQPWIPYVLGMSYLALQQYREAAQSWEKVRQVAPEFETVYFNLADAYIGQHDESTAIKILRDGERRWPADPEIKNAIGVIQVRRGALDAAIESFEQAKTTAPSDPLAYFNLGRAYQMRSVKRQRWVKAANRWMGGDDDRQKAVSSFQQYLQLGGPYTQQAKEALAALGWTR
jgi:VWFA-related protein